MATYLEFPISTYLGTKLYASHPSSGAVRDEASLVAVVTLGLFRSFWAIARCWLRSRACFVFQRLPQLSNAPPPEQFALSFSSEPGLVTISC